jgi:predicted TIM-barrel fold metal-dependent hydrolase
MKIVDIHTHTYPDAIAERTVAALASVAKIVPHSNGTASGLSQGEKEAGISLSVVLPVATKPGQVEKINTRAAAANQNYEETGVFSIGAMHPEYENWYEELARIKELGLKGIKIHPVYQGTDIDAPAFLSILKRCAELGLFVITHAGDDIGYPGMIHCSPEMCLHVTQEIPDLKLVLAHMGGWGKWEDVRRLLADTDVMIDTAFSLNPVHRRYEDGTVKDESILMDDDEFVSMIQLFTADRVLFGTDSPWASQKEYVSRMLALPLTDEEKEKIFSLNALKLLGIE